MDHDIEQAADKAALTEEFQRLQTERARLIAAGVPADELVKPVAPLPRVGFEQAADKAAGDTVPAGRLPGYCIQCGCPRWAPHSTDHDPQWVTGFFGEQAGNKAAGVTVPAEAVETAVNAAYDYDKARYFNAFKSSIGGMTAALAAAAPLIVADRDATIERLKGAIKALDNGLAQHGEHIERLTAERNAARARIAAGLTLLNPSVQAFSRETILKARAALAEGGGSGGERPTIVCLCGSTRFVDAFREANERETLAGKIVLSVGVFLNDGHADKAHLPAVDSPEQKVMLDELHKRKIDLADEMFVVNVGGYIGESTRSEIEYAERHGKPVRYLEPGGSR